MEIGHKSCFHFLFAFAVLTIVIGHYTLKMLIFIDAIVFQDNLSTI
ncbi:hypothetical protein BD847_3726 [Flavobacterium cutihirudinis]|uniref:Uncharacterized protein n=1 Tax=Flavobacterium cutihirudinis TaxID=1265740 RepID=A0A3D9FKD3_9FLAO|nr:hypothetical protein BD847_3726 [Flavobacterium cutihirudinis]